MNATLSDLREELHYLNHAILKMLNRRAHVVQDVFAVKKAENIPFYVPERERLMLDDLVAANEGPFSDKAIRHLFKEIFHASVRMMEEEQTATLRVSRAARGEDFTLRVGSEVIGDEQPCMIAGPCAVETEEQMDMVARGLSRMGIRLLRGGAYKPRSSPDAFQGLGELGLRLLREAADRYGMLVVTEVVDTRQVEMVSRYADMLQVGTRNMYNYELLKEVGRGDKPVLLKRGFSATIDEFLQAAEYVVKEGNERVILCERGIRTHERQTRNTLDISAIPILRQLSYLPVIVDVSHAAGRKDILASLARASLAAGANGLMVEVHPFPVVARSDSQQQLDLDEFALFLRQVGLGSSRPVRECAEEGVVPTLAGV